MRTTSSPSPISSHPRDSHVSRLCGPDHKALIWNARGALSVRLGITSDSRHRVFPTIVPSRVSHHCRRYERGVLPVPAQPPTNNPMADFGPNEWLVDELYQQYLQDKNSVNRAWWEFFADFHPGDGGNGKASDSGAPTSSPSTEPQPFTT